MERKTKLITFHVPEKDREAFRRLCRKERLSVSFVLSDYVSKCLLNEKILGQKELESYKQESEQEQIGASLKGLDDANLGDVKTYIKKEVAKALAVTTSIKNVNQHTKQKERIWGIDVIQQYSKLVEIPMKNIFSVVNDIKKNIKEDYSYGGDKALISYTLSADFIDAYREELKLTAEIYYEDCNHIYDDENPGCTSKDSYDYYICKDTDDVLSWYVF
jgi:hypothetical protein